MIRITKRFKNPKGGLSAYGRARINRATGSNLRPPVRSRPNSLSEYSYNKIADGNYNQFTFSFVDSLGRAIVFQDPNTLILLLIKNKKELLF